MDSKLKWNVFGNWSTNRNEVTALEGTESLFLNGFTGSSSRAVLNQPLGVLWGGKFDRDASGALILDANGFPTAAASEGDPRAGGAWMGCGARAHEARSRASLPEHPPSRIVP